MNCYTTSNSLFLPKIWFILTYWYDPDLTSVSSSPSTGTLFPWVSCIYPQVRYMNITFFLPWVYFSYLLQDSDSQHPVSSIKMIPHIDLILFYSWELLNWLFQGSYSFRGGYQKIVHVAPLLSYFVNYTTWNLPCTWCTWSASECIYNHTLHREHSFFPFHFTIR